ncbi:hypothetical protein DL767_009537 [Monosporascus sp. MG133]|nr:hypothetical protein DL767_009537 [Monosporascus sp. MG133]
MTAIKQLASGDRLVTDCEFVQHIILNQVLSSAIQEGLGLQQEGAQKAEGKGQAPQTAGPMPAVSVEAGKKAVEMLRHAKFVGQHSACELLTVFLDAVRLPDT